MTFTNTYIIKLTGAFFARIKVLLAIAGILLLSLLIACSSEDEDGGGGSSDTYTVGGTVAGHTGDVSLALTYGEETETLKIETDTDKFTFVAKLEDKQSFTIGVTAPDGQTCSSSITEGTIVDANVTNVEVTCKKTITYSISGEIAEADFKSQVYIVLTVYDDSTGTGGTKQTIRGSDEMFTFTGIPGNKFYTLEASSSTIGETCSGTTTTPVLVTTDVTGAQITCSKSSGLSFKIAVISYSYKASDVTVNVFIGDGAIPDTSSATPVKVVKGSDADVLVFPNIYGFGADGFFYNIPIENGKYYAMTVSTDFDETCTLNSDASGGPVAGNISSTINCR